MNDLLNSKMNKLLNQHICTANRRKNALKHFITQKRIWHYTNIKNMLDIFLRKKLKRTKTSGKLFFSAGETTDSIKSLFFYLVKRQNLRTNPNPFIVILAFFEWNLQSFIFISFFSPFCLYQPFYVQIKKYFDACIKMCIGLSNWFTALSTFHTRES